MCVCVARVRRCVCACVCCFVGADVCILLTKLVDVVLCLCFYVYCLLRHFPCKTWSLKNLFGKS